MCFAKEVRHLQAENGRLKENIKRAYECIIGGHVGMAELDLRDELEETDGR